MKSSTNFVGRLKVFLSPNLNSFVTPISSWRVTVLLLRLVFSARTSTFLDSETLLDSVLTCFLSMAASSASLSAFLAALLLRIGAGSTSSPSSSSCLILFATSEYLESSSTLKSIESVVSNSPSSTPGIMSSASNALCSCPTS